jgi:hypothetical protein
MLLSERQCKKALMNPEERTSLLSENCGTLEDAATPLPPSVIETMKIVFRETHGGEMTPEDREFLGIADQ